MRQTRAQLVYREHRGAKTRQSVRRHQYVGPARLLDGGSQGPDIRTFPGKVLPQHRRWVVVRPHRDAHSHRAVRSSRNRSARSKSRVPSNWMNSLASSCALCTRPHTRASSGGTICLKEAVAARRNATRHTTPRARRRRSRRSRCLHAARRRATYRSARRRT